MKWNKRGHIFDPSQHTLANGCLQFAQSPQALVFDDFVRIYFSTRSVDVSGKYLSHIAFVDMAKNLHTILRISNHQVISLGALGTYDEHGIFPLNPLRVNNLIYGYICGWSRRVSVSVDTAIGLAISSDQGLTFQRAGSGPILSASLHEPCLVGDGFVKVFDEIYHMWYIFGTGWKKYSDGHAPDRVYKIGHATSVDGINWVKEEARQIVSDRLGVDECQALPTVIKIGHAYHMFFCYRESYDFRKNPSRGYRIGHATSIDLSNWIRDDESLSILGTPGTWDSDMQCYPHAFECNERIYLLYNGNDFGRHGFGLAELEF